MEARGGTTLTLQQALDLGVQHHQAGRMREAEGIYRQILASDPSNPHALHLMGVLFSQIGQNEVAVDYLRRAIALNPTAAQYQCNLGAALVTAGRYEEAVETYLRALILQPDVPDAYANMGIALMRLGKFSRAAESLETALKSKPNDFKILDSLGNALSQAGRQEEAIQILQRALAQRTDYAPTYHTFGNALLRLERLDEAEAAYRSALALRPAFPDVLFSLAGILVDKGGTDEAIELARRALKLQPSLTAAWYHLGRALHKQNRLPEALDAIRQALLIDGNFYFAYNELGNILLDLKRHDESIEAFHKLIELAPSGVARYNLGSALWQSGRAEEGIAELKAAEKLGFTDPQLYNNLGAIHHELGRYDEAADFFRRAMSAGGDFPLARFNLAMLQLMKGDFKDGWAGYESRWEAKSLPMPARYAQLGFWDGNDPGGRRILLDCEQGFGDAIQFARYVPVIAERGGKPILATPVELRRLLKTVPGLEGICSPPEELPPFDVQCPLLSLGHLFGTTLETIPSKTPYLFADAALAERWTKRVPSDHRLKIGLCWSGNLKHLQDRFRSLSVADLAPLGQVANTWYCSLQKTVEGQPAVRFPEGLQVTDWTTELADFADTASLIANLDLVIACDTAVAHLAGAMGKPVWVLLPLVADWRWLLGRTDSPWYPTMQLFRQATRGDWGTPVGQICEALRGFRGTDVR